MGGFNLDKEKQNFMPGDTIPAGTLAIKDEKTKTVQVIKTAKVLEVDAEDKKKVTLYVDEFYAPCFALGDKVLKTDAISGTFEAAPSITKIEKSGTNYVIYLSAEISGLAKDNVIEEVVDSSSNAASRGSANSALVADVFVDEFEVSVDVTADTMQYEMYERRVPPIPASQKDATGAYLKINPHVKLTQSF